MAGSVPISREHGGQAPRNSSIDSAISAISSKSQPNKGAAPTDTPTTTADIAHLIKTAGSAEAVIQYLLKEKNSQTQQNSQLWRLVDKQRAMILGLNKDLERALKDKEKYRKKLKEVLAMPELNEALETRVAGSSPASVNPTDANKDKSPQAADLARTQALSVAVPDSPNLDSDSQKHSPVDMAMAPYPITPPADGPNPLPSAVDELLNPAHAMPKPEEHALDGYNHEATERAADDNRKEDANQQFRELPINLSLPPSRSLPSEPPSVPPPRPPPALPTGLPGQPQPSDAGLQFPAPPPRKAPPTPLHLVKGQRPGTAEEDETDTDYDDILEVDEIISDKRGRRRTREEDERDRHIQALKDAEVRSLSQKSNAQGSPSVQESAQDRGKDSATIPLSPRQIPPPPIIRETTVQASLNGMMNGELNVPPALMSPGLPSSPRPFGLGMGGPRSPMPLGAPPLSPRGHTLASAPPLSPRPPRQPIPLPPGAQLTGSSLAPSAMGLPTPTPKPLAITKSSGENSPSTPTMEQPSSTHRTAIFKGLVTEEYPDLLMPPNALPSVDVRVASSRMKPSRASLISLTQLEEDPVFTLAIISRADGGELWRVEKDSASLSKLDSRMKQCAAFTARTPDRSLFSGHAPAKLDARRIALDSYLDELMNSPLDVETALELCKYLSTNTLPPNSDETVGVRKKVSPVATRKGAGGRPLISGYLTKRGKNFGGWKARYFALEGPLLKYYETPGGAHLGTIKLQNAQIGKQAQHQDNQSPARGPNSDEADNQYRHAFLILEPKKKDTTSHVKHVLCAESDMERDQWVETLLQWIDYRDPDDEDQPAQKRGQQERRGSNDNATKSSKGQPKKKRDQVKSQHQQSNSETLIGVSYDSTTPGDAPQGMPRGRNGATSSDRPRTAGGERPKTGIGLPGNPHDTDFQIPVISAPRDPQVISDSSAWGAKSGLATPGLTTPGLAPPSYEEKKQRKRSFFGFGPKTRTSSDGQDSLFEGSSTPPQNEYKGPIRQVFGAPLSEAVRFNGPVDISVPLPAVVYRCIQYLDARNAIAEEGIFRLSGSNVVIKQLRERFNNESDVDLVNDRTFYDIHAVASLLKLYLRELPTTILTRDLHLEFLAVTELSNLKEKVVALSELVVRLPQANATLLKYLIAFLIKIINNADLNKMTVRNVGIVFSPTLNIPAPVFAMFLQNYEPIFGIEPEEYELPSPTSESDTQSQGPGRPSFEPQPRPSTSQGSNASPHRQRLLQNVMDAPRASPTPPLLMNLNEARGSPTPPPAFPMNRPTVYEPQYLAQQGASGTVLRPAYESGFVVPPGFDPTSFYNPPPRPNNPGYDRPIYEGDFNKRRESAIFGAGAAPNLTPQASKSRLREGTFGSFKEVALFFRQRAASLAPNLLGLTARPEAGAFAMGPISRASEGSPHTLVGSSVASSPGESDSVAAARLFDPSAQRGSAVDAPLTATVGDGALSTAAAGGPLGRSTPQQQRPPPQHATDVLPDHVDDAKRPRACEACRGLKVRCEMAEEGPCRRCLKARRRCVVTARTRTGERQKKTDTRVSELEKKIDALTATLQARTGPEPMAVPLGAADVPLGPGGRPSSISSSAHHSSVTAILSPDSDAASATERVGSYASTAQKRKLTDIFGTESREASQKKPATAKESSLGADYVDFVDRGIMSPEVAEELFARYSQEMVYHLPGVIFPPTERAVDLRNEKPLLFLAVMASAAAARPELQRQLIKELMEIFARKVICNGEKSLELVQALLVSVAWYFPPDSFEELKFYQFIHIACVMALDLGLGRGSPVRRKPTGAASNAINFFTFRPGKEDPESLECRRTWLMCYYLSSNAAMGLRRPYLVRWSAFIEESVKLLETSAEAAPTDKHFCILLRINKLGEDVSTRFSVDDPAMAATLQDFGTQLALRGFEVELERLKRSIPESLMQPVIILGIEYLNIYMHESCLQNANTDTFKSCLTSETIDTMMNPKSMGKAQIDALLACVAAITTSFDTFLGMDITRVRCLPVFNFVRIAYSLVILIKVNLAMASADTPLTTIIADNLRAETYLDSLLAKLSEASSEGKCRPAGKFLSVLSTLKGWFTNKGVQQRKNGRPERHSGNEAGPGLRPFSSPTPTVGTTTAESGVRSGPTTRQSQAHQANYPATSTANTPLQLLSEVATGDSGARHRTADMGWSTRAGEAYGYHEGRSAVDMQTQVAWPPTPLGLDIDFETMNDGIDWDSLAMNLGLGLPVTEAGLMNMMMVGDGVNQVPGLGPVIGVAPGDCGRPSGSLQGGMGGWNPMYQN